MSIPRFPLCSSWFPIVEAPASLVGSFAVKASPTKSSTLKMVSKPEQLALSSRPRLCFSPSLVARLCNKNHADLSHSLSEQRTFPPWRPCLLHPCSSSSPSSSLSWPLLPQLSMGMHS
ncbi:hypothetical protein Droror1_Dr00024976 [Drosera rotundifolia]